MKPTHAQIVEAKRLLDILDKEPVKMPELYNPPRRIRFTVGCAYCKAHASDAMMPHHDASPRCESGKHNHCTCDTCF